ncbi:hypothetical protein [Rhodobacter sp. CZR27]|uniref:hypothetical protein n=1 Tax=Rhodobacter sp. CZR27 TaxID=2033869 RepID=UPI001E310496|nr:hypothetical protein [Rhodobacter sp. CZR27]
MAVTIETRGSEIRDTFLAKMAETFDAQAVERKARAWDWIFSPPLGPDAPAVRVLTAWRDGRFVGGSITGVSAYMLHGERRYFLSPFGTNIDPKERGLGINLIKAFYAGPARRIGIPIDERFARVNEKYGAHSRARVQMFAPLRAGSALARRKPAAAPVAGLVNAVWSAWRALSGLGGSRLRRGETITVAQEFGAEHDAFWQKAVTHHPFIQVRDSAFMVWRFRDMPLQKYDVLQLRRDGELRGYVAIGHDTDPKRGTAQVTDILTIDDDPRDLALLFRAASRRLENLGAEVAVFGCVVNEALMQAARMAGFSRSKPTRPAQIYYGAAEDAVSLDEDLGLLYLTRADQDEDY